ncbi:MAG: MarR family transcriptional regulator [Pseudonocardia sp.]
MTSISSANDDRTRHRRLAREVKESLRELGNQLSLLNHHVGARVALKDVDMDCLDVVARHGPLSPSALARRAGLHPATMTGILDRLQRGGWIVRERDPEAADRRSVTVRVVRGRTAELFRLYRGMSTSLDALCAEYTEADLAMIAGFLRRTSSAGEAATDELSRG